ncbi:hypothetical protein [Streptomyces parvus]|uniref:hypothetical protein n=1 Tax=Streptomyces parvus TaxID=66428 RepID=UPI002100AA3A|nr:hypothetical protein [Streptomyces parvus]MCQ1581203.1 hypothetical protein [Streptomyces parvus]
MSRPSVDLFVAWALCCLTVLALAAPLWAAPVGAVLERIQGAAVSELYEQSATEFLSLAGRGPGAGGAELAGWWVR